MAGLDVLGRAACILQYVVLSVVLILFNKWQLKHGGFPLPLCLVTLHMAQGSLMALALRLLGWVEASLPWDAYVSLVLPIGFLFAGAVCSGTVAFLYLSVPFIQMIKAWTPAVVLMLSFAVGLESPSPQLALIILVTSGGVALTVYGELEFVLVGFLVMAASDCIEALRLVLVELLYARRSERLSGLSGVYFLSPVCFACAAPVALYFEGDELRTVIRQRGCSPALLLLNGVCAFALNISSLVLIKKTSALTLRVVGVLKDWIVIVVSAWAFHTDVQPTQWLGYGIAFVGVGLYSRFKYTQTLAAQEAAANGAEGEARPLLSATPTLGRRSDLSSGAGSEAVPSER